MRADPIVADLDVPDTWPAAVRAWAIDRAAAYAEDMSPASDLGKIEMVERELEFRRLFGELKLRVYHCTRLIENEADAVRHEGLRVLSEELIAARIARAHELGLVSASERDRLLANTVYARANADGRAGRLALLVGQGNMIDDATGCAPLLACWGGEAIYSALADRRDAPRLGRPALVTAALAVTATADMCFFPALPALFVGALLGSSGSHGEVSSTLSVPAADVLGISYPRRSLLRPLRAPPARLAPIRIRRRVAATRSWRVLAGSAQARSRDPYSRLCLPPRFLCADPADVSRWQLRSTGPQGYSITP